MFLISVWVYKGTPRRLKRRGSDILHLAKAESGQRPKKRHWLRLSKVHAAQNDWGKAGGRFDINGPKPGGVLRELLEAIRAGSRDCEDLAILNAHRDPRNETSGSYAPINGIPASKESGHRDSEFCCPAQSPGVPQEGLTLHIIRGLNTCATG